MIFEHRKSVNFLTCQFLVVFLHLKAQIHKMKKDELSEKLFLKFIKPSKFGKDLFCYVHSKRYFISQIFEICWLLSMYYFIKILCSSSFHGLIKSFFIAGHNFFIWLCFIFSLYFDQYKHIGFILFSIEII